MFPLERTYRISVRSSWLLALRRLVAYVNRNCFILGVSREHVLDYRAHVPFEITHIRLFEVVLSLTVISGDSYTIEIHDILRITMMATETL
jgi:hypothetical protein